MIQSDIKFSWQTEDHKQYLITVFFFFNGGAGWEWKYLPDGATITRTAKCLLYVVTTFKKILMNYFENKKISTPKADDSCGTILPKSINSSDILVSCQSEFKFRCKLIQCHLNVSCDISCNLWRLDKKPKVAS